MGTFSRKKIATLVLVGAVVFHIIMVFPVLRFNNTTIPLFAYERLVSDLFPGRVLGDRVLQTEHGEITLRHLTTVSAGGDMLRRIDEAEFRNGRASHNLVVEGIEIPQNIHISFNLDRGIASISTINFIGQKIMLSGIPVNVDRFHLNHRSGADIVMTVGGVPEYIVLEDSTKIHVAPARWGWGGLRIYNETRIWVLSEAFYGFLVKRPYETEFTRYRAITFRPDWGEFIEGELWEQ